MASPEERFRGINKRGLLILLLFTIVALLIAIVILAVKSPIQSNRISSDMPRNKRTSKYNLVALMTAKKKHGNLIVYASITTLGSAKVISFKPQFRTMPLLWIKYDNEKAIDDNKECFHAEYLLISFSLVPLYDIRSRQAQILR